MKKTIKIILIVVAVVLLLIVVLGSIGEKEETSPILVNKEWSNPQKVEIVGYDGSAMEPFISPDSKYLFFNNEIYPTNSITNIHYAEKISDGKFQYLGELPGGNVEGVWDGVPSMDSNGDFYFTSVRPNDAHDPLNGVVPILYQASFNGSSLSDIELVKGDIEYGERGWINADSAINDGVTLYLNQMFVGKNYDKFIPEASKFRIAIKQGDEFNIDTSKDYILDKINSDEKDIEYAQAVSYDGLEFYFTRLKLKTYDAKIYVSKRSNTNEQFGEPHIIAGIANADQDDFVEAPSITQDGKTLYYHKLDGERFNIYKVTRD